jgi:hypothetical protein
VEYRVDIVALRKRLSLTPHDALSFGAADRSGWMNVEIVDTLSGDFRVVGQTKGSAFRPMGASQATMHLGPRDRREENVQAAHEDEQQEGWAKFIAGPTLVLFVFALVRWHTGSPHPFLLWTLRTGMMHSALYLLAALVWFTLTFTFFTRHVSPNGSGAAASPARLSPAETMASEEFSTATVSCPHCGSPVSDEQCDYCGWVRGV